MKVFLKGLSSVYSAAMDYRNNLFEKNKLEQVKLPVPVISVGNITMGGTGKTPVVAWLLSELLMQGKAIAVVSRAYKASAKDPVKVDVTNKNSARIFGDEPSMLAYQFPMVDFYVGQSKAEIARFATKQKKYDVLVVDDGFQHRQLCRDLDIVLLDATEKIENYEVVPLGRAREEFSNLNRADMLFITKSDQVGDSDLNELTQILPASIPHFEFKMRFKGFKNLQNDFFAIESVQKQPVFLSAGIARPEVFEKMMHDQCFEVFGTRWFADHYQYTQQDLDQLLADAKKLGAILVVTEKDLVKFKSLASNDVSGLFAVSLEIEMKTQKEAFNEILSKIFSS